MSTKDWICHFDSGANIYQDIYVGDASDNPNPVIFCVVEPRNFKIQSKSFTDGVQSHLSVEIDASRFDSLALAWYKKRNLL